MRTTVGAFFWGADVQLGGATKATVQCINATSLLRKLERVQCVYFTTRWSHVTKNGGVGGWPTILADFQPKATGRRCWYSLSVQWRKIWYSTHHGSPDRGSRGYWLTWDQLWITKQEELGGFLWPSSVTFCPAVPCSHQVSLFMYLILYLCLCIS